MRSTVLMTCAAFMAMAMLSGCSKSDKDGAKPAQPGDVKVTHNKGDRGGKKFHLQEGGKDNHKFLCECVFKDGRLALYVLDHNDTKKSFKAEEAEIAITGVKHDGKYLPPIKLAAKEKDGEHWFEATGDAIPQGLSEMHDLAGGTFAVTVGKTKLNHTFTKAPDASHEKEKQEKAKN